MTAQYAIQTGLTALTAATAKTLVEINTGANTPTELIALKVSSSYLTSATPITLTVELGTTTATGTGTAFTPKRTGQAVGVAQSTVKINDTVEPTGFTVVDAWDLTLPGDRIDYLWPLGREYFLGPMTSGTSALNAIRVTASAACSVRVTAWIEE
ncbi:MAG: hypothetical protein ACXVXZ_08235 [Mycobacteriaceae bacterium]